MNNKLLKEFLKETDRIYKEKRRAYLRDNKRFPRVGDRAKIDGEIYKVINVKYGTIYVFKNTRRTIMRSQVNLVAQHDHA